jgi:glycosyltransferase involved in cell wall biosynthesis
MLTQRDFVIVGLQPWDIEIGSNCKNIALELARNNRVLYVNAPLDRGTAIKKLRQQAKEEKDRPARKAGLKQIGSSLWKLDPPTVIDSINWLPDGALFTFFNKRNNRKFAKDIRKALDELNFTSFILFNDGDMLRSFYLQEYLRPALSIYYTRDNLLSVPYWRKHGRQLEPALMKKSSLVTGNSVYLCDIARRSNPNTFYVGSGCELSLFDPSVPQEKPDDLRAIPGPVIGYLGMIFTQRLDLALLIDICKRRPDWSFVFAGKEDAAFSQSALHQLKNVHFLGMKKGDRLPAYLAFMDVAINPQLVNDVTIGNYPRKIDEYLAMGKPVVATRTVTMESFEPYVYLASGADEYIACIEKALAENSPALSRERIAFARTHTWENSVDAIGRAIEQVEQKEKIPV